MMWCGDLEMMMLAKVDVELTSDKVMSLMTSASKDDRVAMCGQQPETLAACETSDDTDSCPNTDRW